jgi:spore germination protein
MDIKAYYLNNDKLGKESVKKNYSCINGILPTWIELKSDGSLLEKQTSDEVEFLKGFFKRENIIPLVQNYQLDSVVSNLFIDNSLLWDKGIVNFIDFISKYNISGINLDLEGINKNNREKFIDFIMKAVESFHNNSYRIGFSIPAKSKDNNSNWTGAYDYKILGKFADELLIMAYDYHWSGGVPGPIAPLFWVQDVIDYMIINIPLEKIYLGIPLYGYDWYVNNDNKARGLSYIQIENIIKKYDITPEWDQESQSPYFRYNDVNGIHEVWFENENSIMKKLKLVKEYQLAGVVFWRIGLEDKRIWSTLGGLF